MDQKSQKKQKIIMQGEGIQSYYSSFFSLEASNDDLAISFGQRVPSSEDEVVYGIGRRIAMTHSGAKVLLKLLGEAVENIEKKSKTR